MKCKRMLVFLLAAAMVLGLLPPISLPAASAVESAVEDRSAFNLEGVWITEIYCNDVNRSIADDTRAADGRVTVNTYDTTSEVMDFFEICNTHTQPIKLNELYEFYQNDNLLTVTTESGSSDITLNPGQVAVLRNYRSDLTVKIPTEAEFRTDMQVPGDVLVLRADKNGGWGSSSTFSVKNKQTGKTVSTFSVVNETHVADGLTVDLKLPFMESSTMEVYKAKNLPSPGRVYSPQVNGLISSGMDAATVGKGVYITEIRANDVNRSASYGLSDDFMECIEIYNGTDQAIDLNKDYQLVFVVRESFRRILPVYKYSSTASGHVGSSSGCTVPAGGTAVLWCYRESHLSGYSSFPTLSKFRSAYSISSDTPVYIFTAQNGLTNTFRGLELYSLDSGGKWKEKVSTYFWHGETDCADNTSAILKINPEGPEMLLHTGNGTTTMGKVDPEQLAFDFDTGGAMEMRVADDAIIPASIKQGSDLRALFYYKAAADMPRVDTALYYRFDGAGEWIRATQGGIRVPNIYEGIVTGDEVFDHDYLEFYAVNSNAYRTTVCGIYTVDIEKLNSVNGVRTNIREGQILRGTVAVTGSNGGSNADTKIYIDGTAQTICPMPEDGAYLSYYADGRDTGYRITLTNTSNKEIANIGKWIYANTTGQVTHIDSSHFTYSASANQYTTTLRFWAGTFGARIDDHLCPSANRDDFTVTNLKLKIPNGKSYLPSKIGPSSYGGVDTSEKTNLSTAFDAVHKVGDSSNWCPYMDVTFTVPAGDVDAVGLKLDTTKLTNGTHTLKVTSGTHSSTVKFIVDNTAPSVSPGIANGSTVTGQITVNPTVRDNIGLQQVVVLLDDQQISVPYTTTAYELGKGSHTLKVSALDIAGNETNVTSTFTVSDVSMTRQDIGTRQITNRSAEASLTVSSTSGSETTFYHATAIAESDITAETSGGIVPHIRYTVHTGELSDSDEILLQWSGSASGVDNTHAISMFVKNVTTGKWERIGTADSKGNLEITSFKAKDHLSDGTAEVIVQCTAENALPDLDTVTDGKTGNNAGWDGNGMPQDYDFAFAWITDTQIYAQKYQKHFKDMNQWIVDNLETRKIRYLMHIGDIIDDWDKPYQWERADVAMKILDDSGVPYGVLAGNHDVASSLGQNETYWQYFGEHRYQNQPTYGGSYRNNLGHYDLISENGQDFIIVYMSWNIYEDEINWMNQVLAEHADRKAILCFHTYTHVRESEEGLLDYFGTMIKKRVVKKNPNVFAVLNGHYSGSTFQTVMFDDDGDGVKERTVYQICTDYQSVVEGGQQYVKFLYFDLDNDKIYMNSYSPYLDDYNYYDTAVVDLAAAAEKAGGVASAVDLDKMILTTDFDTKKQTISATEFRAYVTDGEAYGTAQADAAGTASLPLAGLEPETAYHWFAVTTNPETGYMRDAVQSFTTLPDPEVTGLEILQLPAKLTYLGRKDALDVSGGMLKVSYSDGSSREIPMSADTVTGFDNTVAGIQTLTVTVGGQAVTFQVEIILYSTVCLSGSMNGWSDTANILTGSEDTLSTDITLDAGTYTFRILADGTPYGSAVTVNDAAQDVALTANGSDCTLIATGGDYRFIFDPVSKTLSIVHTAPAAAVTIKSLTLSLEDEVLYNVYFQLENAEVSQEDMGLIIWDSQPAQPSIHDAQATVISGATYVPEKGRYGVTSMGIPAKNLADEKYFAAYAKLSDGSYIYSQVLPYSAKTYCTSMITKSTNPTLRSLCVALMNFGTAAQEFFAQTTDYTYAEPMNADFAQYQDLVEDYRSDMLSALVAVDGAKTGTLGTEKDGFTKRSVSMSADGSFSLNYYFTTSAPAETVTFYYWTAEDYAKADVLTLANASGSAEMVPTANENQFWANYRGIAAKEIDRTVYACGIYTAEGKTCSTGVFAYSIGHYALTKAEGSDPVLADLAKNMAVYSYYAMAFFN